MLPNGHTSIFTKLRTLHSAFKKFGSFATKFKFTRLLIFVSISTCFIHSIFNILVKKPFSFFFWGGGIPNKVYLGGDRSHGPHGPTILNGGPVCISETL